MRSFVILLIFNVLSVKSFSQTGQREQEWVDSVFDNLTAEERMGQLFMLAAYSNKDESHYSSIDSLINTYKIGGLIFMQGGPMRQAMLTNRYQSHSKVPLFIAIDGEWGLSMRLDSTLSFPKQMTLGSIENIDATFKTASEIARQCKRMGIHINFAPVVDINNNPDNPVIGFRSFGENKEKVAQRGLAYMKGLQQNGIMACAKHFPGHGDTDADSHLALPIINHTKKRLNDVEFYPFVKLINEGLQSMMIAHMHVPIYDNRPNVPSTLSPAIVTGALKQSLNFKGLIFTDALNMKGVSKFFPGGEADVQALIAGNDILLFSENIKVAMFKIKAAISDGRLSQKDLDERIKKILKAKFKAGLNTYLPVDTNNLYKDLVNISGKALQHEIYAQAITIVKDEKKLVPVKELATSDFASVSIGLPSNKEYQEYLENYAPFVHFAIPKRDAKAIVFEKILDSVAKFSSVIVSLHDLNNRRKENFGISQYAIDFIQRLEKKTNVIVVLFGNAYGLKFVGQSKTLICAYEDNESTRKIVPQIIFGAIPAKGILPVSVSANLKEGFGITTSTLGRLQYAYPENIGINTTSFAIVDSILNESVKSGCTPGAQLLIAKEGVVIYTKNFGYHTYDKSVPVTRNTIYDLASVTKVAATTQALMFAHDWKLFNPDSSISCYLPDSKGTNKEAIITRDVLVHQAGLLPYVDFWRKTMKNGNPDEKFYSKKQTSHFKRQVSSSLYSSKSLSDSLWKWVLNSSLANEKPDTGCYSYKYSDLAFYFMKRTSESIINQPLEDFLKQNMYAPLGLRTLMFSPLQKFNTKQIVPTEEEKTFRNTIIQGTVHDQAAAMSGGVAGHAGLFSNTNDLAILGQMNLQKGYYGGTRYFSDSTINEFTRQQYTNNRRALAWDRPFPPNEVSLASPSAFGHTGFTGTAWWIDPQYNLVFVLLANRTYPFSDNKRYTTYSIRTKVLNEVYKVLEASKNK